MQARFHMRNTALMLIVEHHHRETLEHIRKVDKRFRGRRIKNVLQAYPSKVRVGVVYQLTYGDGSQPIPAPT